MTDLFKCKKSGQSCCTSKAKIQEVQGLLSRNDTQIPQQNMQYPPQPSNYQPNLQQQQPGQPGPQPGQPGLNSMNNVYAPQAAQLPSPMSKLTYLFLSLDSDFVNFINFQILTKQQ